MVPVDPGRTPTLEGPALLSPAGAERPGRPLRSLRLGAEPVARCRERPDHPSDDRNHVRENHGRPLCAAPATPAIARPVLAAFPGEDPAHGIVPHRAHYHAGGSG